MKGDLGARLNAMRLRIQERIKPLRDPFPRYVLFLSVSEGAQRATTTPIAAASFDAAFAAVEEAVALIDDPRWLRVDWVETVGEIQWSELKSWLAQTKRNYFRYGISLDKGFRIAFLETELNANAMLYGGAAIDHAVLNEKNFARYARLARGLPGLAVEDAATVYYFSTSGIFCDRDDPQIHDIAGSGRNAGRRVVDHRAAGQVEALVARGSRYLAGQVMPSGRFVYGWHPCFDRAIKAYNCLRHASSVYAMIEGFEETRDPGLGAAIGRAIDYLTRELIRPVRHQGQDLAFLVEPDGEIKLGGNAVCLLALTKHAEVFRTDIHLPLLERLGRGVLFMQDEASGAFRHVLTYPDLSVKERFRIIYYDGEAAFGLMRLYALTRSDCWIDAVEKAFGHFIAADHWRAHDHWLSYAVNALTTYRPRRAYFEFGIRNVAGYLDFVAERSTTFPTLLELMMAAEKMVARLAEDPDNRDLLARIDLRAFYDALEKRAGHLLNGHFWPEMAMFFQNPDRIDGSFFIRHHAFRVRIDDVEHYLSGLVAYAAFLRSGRQVAHASRPQRSAPTSGLRAGWRPEELAAATGGTWVTPPDASFVGHGLCIHSSTFRPGQIAVARSRQGERGLTSNAIAGLAGKPAALIASSQAKHIVAHGVPVLRVMDTDKAIFAIGRAARSRLAGKVIAITGSSGKTSTVAMLAHTLSAFGHTERSDVTGNLTRGISWNLAGFAQDCDFAVLEVAIGRMRQSAQIVRPDLAIVTNIFPVHLGGTHTLADIARVKAQIFEGMKPGSVAILNRDMHEWKTVFLAAQAAELRILHFGEGPGCDIRLLGYCPENSEVWAQTPAGEVRYRLGVPGRHMALNSLAVLAAVHALGGLKIELATEKLATAVPLAGRGQSLDMTIQGKRIRLIDDAYNANPGSMAAALERLHHEASAGRRIAVIGEMAELGMDADRLHTELAYAVNSLAIDKVYALGARYRAFWAELSPDRRGAHLRDMDELKLRLGLELRDGDTVLVKGSNSTRLHSLVAWLKDDRCSAPGLAALLPKGVSAVRYSMQEGALLFSAECERIHKPASITKLMTLILAAERLRERGMNGSECIAIPDDARQTDSWWGFEPGEEVDIRTLMSACAVVSANEASNALAEWHSGTRAAFTHALNGRARAVGMTETVFASPSGLGSDQRTTAVDVLCLARHLIAQHPGIVGLCGRRSFSWKGRLYPNTNSLLPRIDGAIGLKTGSLGGTIHNLVFARRTGQDVELAIVLGAPSRRLRDWIVEAMLNACHDNTDCGQNPQAGPVDQRCVQKSCRG
ncbi:Mur ligase family protein [Aureimonas altamirensis]|uniref:Mur ligase family protein n=1 Tax=Aureimonas altamirensis TaxID=370622 RepID=UPI0030170C57